MESSHNPELTSKITASGATFAADVTSLYDQARAAASLTLTEPDWFVVTADQPGVPVQEFLIYRDPPPVPEPTAILLATVAARAANALGPPHSRFGRETRSACVRPLRTQVRTQRVGQSRVRRDRNSPAFSCSPSLSHHG